MDDEGKRPTGPAVGDAAYVLRKTVAIVGLMGCGKSAIGRRLAHRLGVPFADSDRRVEEAAEMTVAEIFASRGEGAFREMERSAVAQALAEGPSILATGGGAFLQEDTRRRLKRSAATLWLRADLDLLARRCSASDERPLLAGQDIEGKLAQLMEERYPVYADADMVLDCADRPREETVDLVVRLLVRHGVLGTEAA